MTGKTKIVFIALFTLTRIGFGQVKYSNEFLNIGVGVRSAGMGNAVVASTKDVTAGYWNPASLLQLENNIELGYQHSELFAGVANYDFGGMGFKIDDVSSAGFSFIRSGVDDIPDTRSLMDANGDINYDRIESFSSVDNAFIFHYARKVGPPPLSIGGSVKIVRRKVGEFASAIGFGVDISALYKLEKVNYVFHMKLLINFLNFDISNISKLIFKNCISFLYSFLILQKSFSVVKIFKLFIFAFLFIF